RPAPGEWPGGVDAAPRPPVPTTSCGRTRGLLLASRRDRRPPLSLPECPPPRSLPLKSCPEKSMSTLPEEARALRVRNLLFLAEPGRWPVWPFLPLVRHGPEAEECGLLCDLMGLANRPGFSATVFLANLFLLPRGLDEFLALPHETYDTPDEVFAA